MKAQYSKTFIYKVCKDLDISLKELAFIMNKSLKCVEFWRKDESSITGRDMQYMKLLLKNKKMEEELKKLDKHTVTLSEFVDSDIFGATNINIKVINGTLKRETKYTLILKES